MHSLTTSFAIPSGMILFPKVSKISLPLITGYTPILCFEMMKPILAFRYKMDCGFLPTTKSISGQPRCSPFRGQLKQAPIKNDTPPPNAYGPNPGSPDDWERHNGGYPPASGVTFRSGTRGSFQKRQEVVGHQARLIITGKCKP